MGTTTRSLAAWVAAAALTAQAQPAVDYKGFAFGTSRQAIEPATGALECLPAGRDMAAFGDERCELRSFWCADAYRAGPARDQCEADRRQFHTYGGVATIGRPALYFDRNGLSAVTIPIAPRDSSALADVIAAKFGPPSKIDDTVLRTAGGAVLDGRVWTWSLPSGTIRVSRFAGSATEGVAILQSAETVRRAEQRAPSATDRVKDL